MFSAQAAEQPASDTAASSMRGSICDQELAEPMQTKSPLSSISAYDEAGVMRMQRIWRRCIYRKHHATLAHFEAHLEIILDTYYEDIKAGQIDETVEDCLRIIEIRQDRFLLHKLAYRLFSGDAYVPTVAKRCVQLDRLKDGLQDGDASVTQLIDKLRAGFTAWKQHQYYRNEPVDAGHMTLFASLFIKIKKMDQDQLATISQGVIPQQSEGSNHFPEKAFELSEYALDDLCRLIDLYIDEKAPEEVTLAYQQLKQFQTQPNAIVQSNLLTAIQRMAKALDEHYGDIFGVAVRQCQFYGQDSACDPQEEIKAHHGGGWFFITDFLLGRQEGYRMDEEEGGVGLYLEPYPKGKACSTNYGDAYYAKRSAPGNFDIPAQLIVTGRRGLFQRSHRHGDEVILRHPERTGLRVRSLDKI